MANLDKLLRKIEKNKETENEVKTYDLTIGGETYKVKTMTRREKRDFIYTQDTNASKMSVGDIVKKMKPFIYRALDLAELAEKAKAQGLIKSYYDVVEALFEPDEIIQILGFITEINSIGENIVPEEIEEIKK